MITSGEPPKEDNGYFETCVEFELIQPRRPSLDFLCKVNVFFLINSVSQHLTAVSCQHLSAVSFLSSQSILGYVEPPNTCLQKAEAAMKLALAVVEKGAKTSIPLTDEVNVSFLFLLLNKSF